MPTDPVSPACSNVTPFMDGTMSGDTVAIVCWNMAHKHESWRDLLDTHADLALLQEVCRPPEDCAKFVTVDPAPWSPSEQRGRIKWRTAIAVLSDRVTVEWVNTKPLGQAGPGDLAVSSPGALTAARVIPRSGESFTAVSLYAELERPFRHAGKLIYSDASSHRLVSDLAALVTRQHGHRIVVAGDLNLMYGYSADGSRYWAGRYRTVFDRLEAMGLFLVGPQFPNGRRAHPWPAALPGDSRNVPTWHTIGRSPAMADRQLDYVFASPDLAVTARALNEPDEWGPSDHCRIAMTVRP